MPIHTTLLLFCLVVFATFSNAHAQVVIDSAGVRIDSSTRGNAAIDSVQNEHSPHKASLRSALLPGWGQIYNKSYWKLPLVYGALGVTAYIFFDNVKTYRELRFAYAARYKTTLNPPDSTDYRLLQPLYQRAPLNSLQIERDAFRRNIDYSVLVFAVFWALNVVDASVDAHLKSFDVSPDLSLRFKAGHSELARTTGFGIVLTFK